MQSTPLSSPTPPPPTQASPTPVPMPPHRAPAQSWLSDPSDPSTPSDPPTPPAPTPRPIPPSRSVREPIRSRLTGRLFSRWEHVSQTQQHATWHLVAQMRVTVAQERTRARQRGVLLGVLIVVIAALDALLLYVVLTAPALLRAL